MVTCETCPKRAGCRALCPAVEAQLPKDWTGEDRMLRAPDAQSRVRRFEMMRVLVRQLLDHRHVLTASQRRVFDAWYNDGMSQREIAEHFGIRRNTVDEHLSRARRRIARHIAKSAR